MLDKDFILEIGTEEIPAAHMGEILEQMRAVAATRLKEERISFDLIEVYGTPRRIVVHVSGMPEYQEDLVREIKGPPARISYDQSGNPTKAALGFAESQGVSITDLQIRSVENGEYVFAIVRKAGNRIQDVLSAICPEIISSLTFRKSMKWGVKDFRFIRPIRWLLAVFNGQNIPFEVAGIRSGVVTYGHRILSSGGIEVTTWDEYLEKLEKAYVMVDQNKRKQLIQENAAKVASDVGGLVVMDENLLDEVTYLVEYPTVFFGSFETEFLKLPDEVLMTVMSEQQKYFHVVDNQGKLLSYFVGIRNGNDYGIDIVRKGNEKVLRARLQDARFFYEQDGKIHLAQRVPELSGIVFQEKLGTMFDKVHRIVRLSKEIAQFLDMEDITTIEKTAYLCKADLVTNMVKEFPELQGIMGKEYAGLSGETESVAEGIYEHYMPRSAEDSVPRTIEGIVVGIADKIDTLVGCFSVGLMPTGSQDPYALRRQAFGILRICDESRLNLSIDELIEKAADLFEHADAIRSDVKSFIVGRWVTLLTGKGIPRELADAVLSVHDKYVPKSVDIAVTLNNIYEEAWFKQLLTSFTRAWNITKKVDAGKVDVGLFVEEEEKQLHSAVEEVMYIVNDKLAEEDYSTAFAGLRRLVEPIDAFFDKVLVMDKNDAVRENRLALLKSVVATMCRVADFSMLYGAR